MNALRWMLQTFLRRQRRRALERDAQRMERLACSTFSSRDVRRQAAESARRSRRLLAECRG